MKKMFIIKLLFAALLFCIGSDWVFSQNPADSILLIRKCNDFEVTGDGSSAEWDKTNWVELKQQGPNESPYTTRAKVLYSATGIYFLYDCVDKKLNATLLGDNLNLFNEDVVEFFLWTDEAYPIYFEYEISPLGYELPILVPNINGRAQGWLPWGYANKQTRRATTVRGGPKESGADIEGWMAEVFVPYRLLAPLSNVPPVSGTKWRANMYRIDYDHDNNGRTLFAWQRVERSFHEYEKFGTFLFE